MILLEDRALLDAFRSGETHALLAVYRHFATDVTRFLHRGFTFNSKGRPCSFRGFRGGYEIEAAVQEVFAKAFAERARLAYNGIDPYRPYLLRIARNLVINDLKSKQPILFRYRSGRPVIIEQSEPERVDEHPLTARIPTAEEQIEVAEVATLIADFKRTLDEREVGVFDARFERGLAAQTAAEQLQLTRSQVRTTEAKLRKRFLVHMQASGYLTTYRAGSPGLSAAIGLLIVAARSVG